MKLLTSFLLLFTISNSCFSQNEISCKYYKIGKYLLFDSQLGINSKIERTESRQIEIDLNSDKYLVFSVNWLSDCEYELIVLEGNNIEQLNFYKGKTIIVKIINTYYDGYKFEGHIKGSKVYKTHIMKSL